MPWQEVSIMEQRIEFVSLASLEGANLSELCRRFGISRQTGYKWLARADDGVGALVDRSRRPLHSPRQVSAEIEQAILKMRDAHPAWGARKIAWRLQAHGIAPPAISTVHAVLRRHGRIKKQSGGRPPCGRFEKPAPNLLWQMDFKGRVRLKPGLWCHPLTILDDHSRFLICLASCGDERTEARFSYNRATTLDIDVIPAHKSAVMEDIWVPLLIRMVVTAAVVIAATAMAERVSPFYASLIGAFPTSAGPAYVMLALKESDAFVAASAVASMASMIAIAPFVSVIVWLAPRSTVYVTAGGGILTWAAFALPISQIPWTPLTALAVNLVVYPLCFWLTRNLGKVPFTRTRKPAKWFELPLRAFVVGLFVAAVVTASNLLGPVATGLGAVFPIVFLSLTVILHIRMGGAATAATMHSALRVVSGMVLALMVLYYGVVWFGEAAGLSLSLLASILWALAMVALNRRTMRRAV